MMVTVSLHTRRPSLMSRPEWRAAKTDLSVHDSALPCLLDALAQLPVLYSERDALVSVSKKQALEDPDRTSISYSAADVQSLLVSSLGLLDDIHAQRTRWMDLHPNSEFPSLPSADDYSTWPCPFPIVTHFSSLHLANAFAFYNCILILLHQFILSLYDLLPAEDRDALAGELATEQVSVAADEILRSIDYHLPFTIPGSGCRGHGAGSPNFYLVFPMRVAFKVISQFNTPDALSKKLWLKEIFDIIMGRAGPWASNKHIFGLG